MKRVIKMCDVTKEKNVYCGNDIAILGDDLDGNSIKVFGTGGDMEHWSKSSKVSVIEDNGDSILVLKDVSHIGVMCLKALECLIGATSMPKIGLLIDDEVVVFDAVDSLVDKPGSMESVLSYLL